MLLDIVRNPSVHCFQCNHRLCSLIEVPHYVRISYSAVSIACARPVHMLRIRGTENPESKLLGIRLIEVKAFTLFRRNPPLISQSPELQTLNSFGVQVLERKSTPSNQASALGRPPETRNSYSVDWPWAARSETAYELRHSYPCPCSRQPN